MTKRTLPAPIGEQLGKYRLLDVLGHGGMACVYLAEHTQLKRKVAIKILNAFLAHDEVYLARFFNEAEVVNRVGHPCVVEITDLIEQDDPRRVASVMELLEGPNLKTYLTQSRLTYLQALNIAFQLGDAMAEVHRVGVVHRDLKPENIVITGDLETELFERGSVKILDFGIAKDSHSRADQTATGVILGTPAYMAPEQIARTEVSPATDIYALGEILFEMLSGHRLFRGKRKAMFRRKLAVATPEIVLPEQTPFRVELTELIERCVAHEEADRPPIDDFLDVVEACLESATSDAVTFASQSDASEAPDLHLGDEFAWPDLGGQLTAVADLIRHSRASATPLEVSTCVHIVSEVLRLLSASHQRPSDTVNPGCKTGTLSPERVALGQTAQIALVAPPDGPSSGSVDLTEVAEARYLAPEQARGEATDERTDVYRAGLLMFELLTLEPYVRAGKVLTVADLTDPSYRAPTSVRSDVPAALDVIALRALGTEADERFESLDEFRDALLSAAAPCSAGQFQRALEGWRGALVAEHTVADIADVDDAFVAAAGEAIEFEFADEARREAPTEHAPESSGAWSPEDPWVPMDGLGVIGDDELGTVDLPETPRPREPELVVPVAAFVPDLALAAARVVEDETSAEVPEEFAAQAPSPTQNSLRVSGVYQTPPQRGLRWPLVVAVAATLLAGVAAALVLRAPDVNKTPIELEPAPVAARIAPSGPGAAAAPQIGAVWVQGLEGRRLSASAGVVRGAWVDEIPLGATVTVRVHGREQLVDDGPSECLGPVRPNACERADWHTSVQVDTQHSTLIEAPEPVLELGTLELVSSRPSDVRLDGVTIGRTPLTVSVEPGVHQVQFARDHTISRTEAVELAPGQSKRVAAPD